MTSSQLVPALIVPLVAWRVYVRFRRNIGRQPFQPRRLGARIAILGVIVGLIAFAALAYLPALGALGGGLLAGALLSLVGLHLTRFEATPVGKFYTPNTQIGVALIVLFVGRIAYRMYVLLLNPPVAGQLPPPMFRSQLTMLIFGVTAGYYIAYSAGVLVRNRRPAA